MERFQSRGQIKFDGAQLAISHILEAFANSGLGFRYSQKKILAAIGAAGSCDAASRALRHRVPPIKSEKR